MMWLSAVRLGSATGLVGGASDGDRETISHADNDYNKRNCFGYRFVSI